MVFCPRCPHGNREDLATRDKAIAYQLQFSLVETLESLRHDSVVYPVVSNSIDAICIEPPRPFSRKPVISLHRVDDKGVPGAEQHLYRVSEAIKVPAYLWSYSQGGLKRRVVREGW